MPYRSPLSRACSRHVVRTTHVAQTCFARFSRATLIERLSELGGG
jgi:hypothetical protein